MITKTLFSIALMVAVPTIFTTVNAAEERVGASAISQSDRAEAFELVSSALGEVKKLEALMVVAQNQAQAAQAAIDASRPEAAALTAAALKSAEAIEVLMKSVEVVKDLAVFKGKQVLQAQRAI